jgi:hypothetical protein
VKDEGYKKRAAGLSPAALLGVWLYINSDQVAALTGDPYDKPHHHQMLEAVSLERGRMDAVIV